MLNNILKSATSSNEGAWDLSYAYYGLPNSDAWDISTAVFSQNFSVSAQESNPEGVFFKPDGTKMYILGNGGNDVNEYSLSTAWDISTASYLQNFSVLAEETNPEDLFFKPDGTKMYIVGVAGDDVNEYSLSTAWDISTASYVQNFSVAAQETGPSGLFFKPDGTKMYIIGTIGDDVNEYTLSTAWDISTASYSQNFSVAAQETSPQSLSFKPDGTKMYMLGLGGDDVNEYSLSTAWDISSASYVQNFSVAAQETNPHGLFFKPDGTKMYIVGSIGDDVNEYLLGGFDVSAQETSPQGLSFKSDGTKMYVVGRAGDDVNEYSLSTAWDATSASYVQNFSIAQDSFPTGLFFKPDGTKMYVCGYMGEEVNEYSLSVAWDISTASYVQNFITTTQEDTPYSVFFKPDGTKMYVGGAGRAIFEYSLSTAWDISTASYVQSFSTNLLGEYIPYVLIKPDGTRMYVGGSDNRIIEFVLSTAWDISTASVTGEEIQANGDTFGLFFKPDGTRLFFVSAGALDYVYQYNLGVE